MKKLLLATLATALLSAAYSQSKKNLYPNEVKKGEKLVQAHYQSILVKTADGLFVRRIFYPEKKVMTHAITFAAQKTSIKNGPYREWYDNGNLWMEGAYKDNQEEGEWAYYAFKTGRKTHYGHFAAGKKHGKWIKLDSLGNVASEEFFAVGQLDGETRIFDQAGSLAIWRVYEKGKLIAEEVFETSYPIDTAKVLMILPFIKGCEHDDIDLQKKCSDHQLLQAIYSQITYPPKARINGVEGKAVFQFVVEKDGSISEMATLRGISADIERECLRVLQNMPAWSPGRKNGEAVRVLYHLPILFKLE